MQLQHIDKWELRKWFPEGVDGFWIWDKPLPRVDEMGALIWQLQSKTRSKLVKLEITYHHKQRLYWENPETDKQHLVSLTHSSTLGDYILHPSNPVARILTKPVPPAQIKLLKVYELLDLVKDMGQTEKKIIKKSA